MAEAVGTNNGQLLKLPGSSAVAAPIDASRAMQALRRFHLGAARDSATALPADALPALLHPFRDPTIVRGDYPLFLFPADGRQVCAPVGELLSSTLQEIAPGGRAKILADNLPRIERFLRREVGEGGSVDADELLAAAGEALQAELNLEGDNATQLRGDYQALLNSLPAGGQLLGLGEHTALQIALVAARQHGAARRSAHHEAIVRLCQRLRALLQVDDSKSADARAPEALGRSIGASGTGLLDPKALAGIVGSHRGTHALPAERRKRIEQSLGLLQSHLQAEAPVALSVVHGPDFDAEALHAEAGEGLELIEAADPIAAVAAHFDSQAAHFAEIFRAMRIAELESEDRYDEERHGPWLEQFDWESFSLDELKVLPPAIAIESIERIAGDGMGGLSRLLLSGRPVIALTVQSPGRSASASSRDALADVRFEAGYFGMGHREAFVLQSTPARPAHLADGLLRTFSATRAALVVLSAVTDPDGSAPRLGPWLHSGAAIEGRANPLFHYDPEQGTSFERRFECEGNPRIDADWPIQELPYLHADGSEDRLDVEFTFADFALLEPGLSEHFQVVPDGFESDDLMPLPEYLQLDGQDAVARIPYVWAARDDGALIRVAVTRRMIQACRDRQMFWRTLQELAGVRNEHAILAAKHAREMAETEARAEREALARAHAEELERVRSSAAGEAMEGVARMLLDLDTGAFDAMPAGGARPAPAAAPAPVSEVEAEVEAEPEPEVEAEEEEEISFDEAYVDTPLCTTCNDCININSMMFVYDANKQVMLGDLSKGTYAQLVTAAEKCPAKCIHPGLPIDKSEPHLDSLIERAKAIH